MPNRIIKESICNNEKIAALSDFEFRLWIGLITQVDDMGRGDARPAIIKGRVFPLRERVTTKDIDAALHALAAKGCISLYTVGGKPYFWFPSWAEHQRVRDCRAKYPAPAGSDQFAASCGELPRVAASCGELRPESESESESESEGEKVRAKREPDARAKRFTPPTLAEVQSYVAERHSPVDPQEFIDFYASKGWMVGKTPMKDWKAACRNAEKWERWEKTQKNESSSFDSDEFFQAAVTKGRREE